MRLPDYFAKYKESANNAQTRASQQHAKEDLVVTKSIQLYQNQLVAALFHYHNIRSNLIE